MKIFILLLVYSCTMQVARSQNTGVGGENTDVLAHLTGFITGAATGWWLGRLAQIPGPRTQWLVGLGALAGIAGAWWAALLPGA